jgi:hypothetical protein
MVFNSTSQAAHLLAGLQYGLTMMTLVLMQHSKHTMVNLYWKCLPVLPTLLGISLPDLPLEAAYWLTPYQLSSQYLQFYPDLAGLVTDCAKSADDQNSVGMSAGTVAHDSDS